VGLAIAMHPRAIERLHDSRYKPLLGSLIDTVAFGCDDVTLPSAEICAQSAM
jgi:hypothetical protein